jgi:hypothetical protein
VLLLLVLLLLFLVFLVMPDWSLARCWHRYISAGDVAARLLLSAEEQQPATAWFQRAA